MHAGRHDDDRNISVTELSLPKTNGCVNDWQHLERRELLVSEWFSSSSVSLVSLKLRCSFFFLSFLTFDFILMGRSWVLGGGGGGWGGC